MNIQQNVPLKNFSSLRIGGPSSHFLEISKIEDLKTDFSSFKKIFILGGGTNVLIDDRGFNGLVVHCSLKGIDQDRELLKIGAGVEISDLLNFCIEHELSGLEWAGGLPGTIGAAVRGNAGAFKGEIKDCVFRVQSFNFETQKEFSRTNAKCEFGYRWSVYKTKPSEFITSVVLKLSKGDSEGIKKSINEKIEYRKLKHPMDYPNIGSTFKNIPVDKVSIEQRNEFKDFTKDDPFPVVLVTKLLALVGLKGKKIGDVQISEKHPNFIVNLGSAKSSDVLKLIGLMKKTVKNKWGIDLEEEIQHLQS